MTLELSRSRPNVIKLQLGDLRWPVDDRLFERIVALVDDHAWRKVKLDFAKVHFLGGTGLGKIVSLQKALKRREVRLVIQNVGRDIFDVFRVTGLTTFLDIRPPASPPM